MRPTDRVHAALCVAILCVPHIAMGQRQGPVAPAPTPPRGAPAHVRSHAAPARVRQAGGAALPNEVLVSIPRTGPASGSGQSILGQVTAAAGQAVDTCSAATAETVLRFRFPDGPTMQAALRALQGLPVKVQPNFRYRRLLVPNDPAFPKQWSLQNTGQTQGGPTAKIDADINAPEAWDLERGDPTIVIGVVDTGVDYTHPDLAANVWHNANDPIDGADNDTNGYADDYYGLNAITAVPDPETGLIEAGNPTDLDGHGTAVAGIIAAQPDNKMGVAGVLWNARIVACKFIPPDDDGCTCDAIKCFDYLTDLKKQRGVNVVATNASWGGEYRDDLLLAAIARHRDAGIVVVAAAGDDHRDNDCQPLHPASAPLSNVIAVAESNGADKLTAVSNCGAHSVHVAAPGNNVLTLKTGSQRLISISFRGTSAAAPHVSGLLGLLAAFDRHHDNVDWPWWKLRNRLLAGGQAVPAAEKTISGRRIRAFDNPVGLEASRTGSLTCQKQAVRRRLLPLASHTLADGTRVARVPGGTPIELVAISIDCEQPVGPVKVVVHSAALQDDLHVALLDDGQAPDQTAGDGIFAAAAPPALAGSEIQLTFVYGPEQVEQAVDNVTVRVVDVLPTPAPCGCGP